jgi:hypothetical protein
MNINPADLLFKDGRAQVEVDHETDCWIWQGYKCRGYGRVRSGDRPSVQAHRVLWEMEFGPIPKGMELGHTCHRRSCVSPLHVRPITKEQNGTERYEIPTLGKETVAAIEEDLKDDKPHGWIQDKYGISRWSIRRLAERMIWRDQFTFELEEVPF